MARYAGVTQWQVRQVWQAADLKPHRRSGEWRRCPACRRRARSRSGPPGATAVSATTSVTSPCVRRPSIWCRVSPAASPRGCVPDASARCRLRRRPDCSTTNRASASASHFHWSTCAVVSATRLMSLRLSQTMNLAAARGPAGIVCTGMTQSASQPGQTTVLAGRARTRSRCALRAPTASAGHWRTSVSLIRTAAPSRAPTRATRSSRASRGVIPQAAPPRRAFLARSRRRAAWRAGPGRGRRRARSTRWDG